MPPAFVAAPATAAECMADDVAMIQRLAAAPPGTLYSRAFFWGFRSVSIGRSQRLNPGVLARAAARGIQTVVRPTGGAVLVHGPGLDVSFSAGVARARGPGPVDLVGEGRRLASPVVNALHGLGVEARFRECEACPPAGESAREVLCLNQRTPFDLLVAGRKVAAFALRRTGGVVFLHGSVLTGAIPQDMVDALAEAGIGSAGDWDRARTAVGFAAVNPEAFAQALVAAT